MGNKLLFLYQKETCWLCFNAAHKLFFITKAFWIGVLHRKHLILCLRSWGSPDKARRLFPARFPGLLFLDCHSMFWVWLLPQHASCSSTCPQPSSRSPPSDHTGIHNCILEIKNRKREPSTFLLTCFKETNYFGNSPSPLQPHMRLSPLQLR